jgi:hypothetical protein
VATRQWWSRCSAAAALDLRGQGKVRGGGAVRAGGGVSRGPRGGGRWINVEVMTVVKSQPLPGKREAERLSEGNTLKVRSTVG